MTTSRLVRGHWIEATKSDQPNNDCVEAMLTDDGIAVRDNKNPDAIFTATPAAWQTLLGSIRK